MYDIQASFDRQILALNKERPTVVFTEPLDARVLEGACHLVSFARPVFLAREDRVKDVIARELGHVDPSRIEFALSESTFVDPADRGDLVEEFARAEMKLGGSEAGRDLDSIRREILKPTLFGIWAVRQGHADMVVGGAAHESRDYFRPMLRLLANRPVVMEAGVFCLPDEHPKEIFRENIVVYGDCGVNATMTPSVLAEIAVGTCVLARDLIPEDVLPRIEGAIISYSNRGSDEGLSPELVRQASALVPALLEERVRTRGERYSSIHITGEVKLSVAMSRRSAMYYSRGPGDADIGGGCNVIICPNLDVGNLLYHLYSARFPTARKFTILFGVQSRAVDLTMDTTPADVRLGVQAAILRTHLHGEWRRTPKDTFFRRWRVLAVNPGSTSTKVAVYENDREFYTEELQHPADLLAKFDGKGIFEQFYFRQSTVLDSLRRHDLELADIDAVAARGGLLRSIPHGTYRVSDPMLADLRAGSRGEHASNLGAPIAAEIAKAGGMPAFIVDPVVVDETEERAKVTGVKAIRRRVRSHALNQIASARRYAREHETFYDRVNVIVAHLGGGISIGAHRHGRYVDVNDGLDGEGPFTPQRSGSLPVGQLIDLCFSGTLTRDELKALNKGKGGLMDLLGTSDLREVERRIDAGDGEATAVFEAMGYQIAKGIAALVPAFEGAPIDQVILTGGMARSQRLMARITALVAGIRAGVTVYPGENEMLALAKGALRVLNGREPAKEYPGDVQGPMSEV